MLPASCTDDSTELHSAEVIDLADVRGRRVSRPCAHCRGPISPSRPRNTRYCGTSCRTAAALARRRWQRQRQWTVLPQVPPVPPVLRSRPHPVLGLAVGLLAGSLFGFALAPRHQLSPFAAADAAAALELRQQLADDGGKEPGLDLWRQLCAGHSSMCAAYIAGVVAANAFLREPLFCPQGIEIRQIEERFAEDLERVADVPEILAARPGTFVGAVLNFAMPCGKPLIEQDDEAKTQAKAKKKR